MAFPGPYAEIYRNEEGEVLGWDNNYPSEPDWDDRLDEWSPADEKFDFCVEFMIEKEGNDTDELYHYWQDHPHHQDIEAAYAAWREK
jgi:hypothetical protein